MRIEKVIDLPKPDLPPNDPTGVLLEAVLVRSFWSSTGFTPVLACHCTGSSGFKVKEGYAWDMQAVNAVVRTVLSLGAGAITFLGTMTMGCDDQGGVSSWERCRSWLGNRILEWPGGDWSPIFPLALGIGVGFLVWWLLGRTALGSATSSPRAGSRWFG